MPGITIYGNDPMIVFDAVRQAADRARVGEGPTLIECLTYRRGGHKRDDPGTYRPEEEVQAWFKTDPLPAFKAHLLNDDRFDEAKLAQIEAEAVQIIDDSVDFALSSEEPQPEVALEDVYA
jgi:pyruvate dehydrogenase E1 component alpha subunit